MADLARELIQGSTQTDEADWTFDSGTATLQQGGRVLHLGNIHKEYSRAPQKLRASLLQKYLALMAPTTISKLWTVAQTKIFPLLRSRYEMVATEIDARRRKETPAPRASRPSLGNLEEVVGYDHGSTIAQTRLIDLAEWGVTLDEAMAQAVMNLNALPKPRWTAMGPAHWRLTSDQGYADSYLLLPQTFATLPAKGSPLVMIPNRGILLASGTEAPGGLEALIDAALLSMRESPWPLCGNLFTVTKSGVAHFSPPDPMPSELTTLARLDISSGYDNQKAALQAYHESVGDAVFVAKYNLMGSDGQAFTSWCAWTEGIQSLLPVTDTVAFVRHLNCPKEMVRVTWADMREIVGHLCRETNDDPQRIRVEGFPDDTEWSRLQARKL